MDINRIIMCVMAFGAALGGLDSVLGNRLGFGAKFEKGFQMLGTVGLSMAGIICLAPVAAEGLRTVVSPVCGVLSVDPGMFGGFLAIDMGGYPLALELAQDPRVGRFAGVIVSAIFGCTLVFTIPVGFGIIGEDDRTWFTRGILLGLTAVPFALATGGLMMGLELGTILLNSLLVFIISAALAVGVALWPSRMIRGFRVFAGVIRAVAILGLTLAAVSHLSGVVLLKSMVPLTQAMETVCSICIVMLGCLPLAELMQRLLKVPFRLFGEKTGLDSTATTALLLGLFSGTPALALIPEMNSRGKVVVSAWLVSTLATFGPHFAFAGSVEPGLVGPMLIAKLTGGILAAAIAMVCTRQLDEQKETSSTHQT